MLANWQEIVNVLDENIQNPKMELKPILIAHKILDEESNMILSDFLQQVKLNDSLSQEEESSLL